MYHSRGKNKQPNPYTFQDMYKEYIKEVEKDSPYDIPYSKFKDICSDYYRAKMEHVLNGGIFIMPFSLGSLSVIKKKPKEFSFRHLNVDWENTSKLGKLVHHINDHSNYFKFRFLWSKQNTRCANKKMYNFIATRANKRKLASLIKSGNTDYFEL